MQLIRYAFCLAALCLSLAGNATAMTAREAADTLLHRLSAEDSRLAGQIEKAGNEKKATKDDVTKANRRALQLYQEGQYFPASRLLSAASGLYLSMDWPPDQTYARITYLRVRSDLNFCKKEHELCRAYYASDEYGMADFAAQNVHRIMVIVGQRFVPSDLLDEVGRACRDAVAMLHSVAETDPRSAKSAKIRSALRKKCTP